ncbi:MAG TPA: hypothetical protein VIZ66_03615 [Sphingomicrobium sp.]
MRFVIILACASFGIASAAVAKDPATEKDDKVVCKRQYDADTGSHFAAPKKVCMKKSEWKELEAGVESSVERIRQQGGACLSCLKPGNGGPG